MLAEKQSEFIKHESCPKCGSKDNLARYSDHAYCFSQSCGYYEKSGEILEIKKPISGLIQGEYKDLVKRKISEETCKKFGYKIGTYNNQKVQIAPYYNSEYQMIAQHIRFPNKDFKWLGVTKNLQFFGQHLFRDNGKLLVICEGEIDAMSVSQYCFGNKYPVVSIPSGVASAKKTVVNNIEWLESFENVVFCFDSDEAGKKASIECASLLSPSKSKVAFLPSKDPNEMVLAGKTKELTDAIWGSKIYRPDGIVSGEDVWDLLVEDTKDSDALYPFIGLNTITQGIRLGEIITLCAGTGIGKSQVCREIAYHLISNKHKVGYIALEESVQRSIRGLVSIGLNSPIHLQEERNKIPEQKLKQVWEDIKSKCYFYDHWGSLDSNNLFSRIKYLAQACECKFIVLDHLSIVVSGISEGDERRTLDNLMTTLRKLTEQLNISLLLISHLKRPEGNKSHEENLKPTISQLRGSQSIAQLSDIILGLSRNSSTGDNNCEINVLKNRFSGETGLATTLSYNKETGRLTESTYEEI